uniref:Chitin-binding type-2 domain-containing protein n=1 Tax=Parastrongyloides trichosuri TaxID=131310 RepID=A0A0N4ZZJ5_PARTI
MAESQGYKRTDAVFSISCGSIQELSPWDTIPDSIAEMEYEDCHYTDGFDPILEKNLNITCGLREYLSGISRISGTKTSLMCCKLRTRDISKCVEKEFDKPLGDITFVEIQYDGMLVNSIFLNENTYTVKFCNFMPRAVGFIYDDFATASTRPPTTKTTTLSTVKYTTPTFIPKTNTQTSIHIQNIVSTTFPTLISKNEIIRIANLNNDQVSRYNAEEIPFQDNLNVKPIEEINPISNIEVFEPTMINFESEQIHSDGNNNHLQVIKNNSINSNLSGSSQFNLNKNDDKQDTSTNILQQETNGALGNTNLTNKIKDEIPNYSRSEVYHLDGEFLNVNPPNIEEKNGQLNEKENINDNNETLVKMLETKNRHSTIDPLQRPSFNTEYRYPEINPTFKEEKNVKNNDQSILPIISTSNNPLTTEVESNKETITILEELPQPNPLPMNNNNNNLQPLSSISSSERVDIARATVAKLHHSLKYKKYNANRNAYGSKIVKVSDNGESSTENSNGILVTLESIPTTTTKYSTTPYVPRMNRKIKQDVVIENANLGNVVKPAVEVKSYKAQIINDDDIKQEIINSKDNDMSRLLHNKSKLSDNEMIKIEKNTNLMISKVDEFAQVPFEETININDDFFTHERTSSQKETPIQKVIKEQYQIISPKPATTRSSEYKKYTPHTRQHKPVTRLHNDDNTSDEEYERHAKINRGPLIDEDTSNSPFDDPMSDSYVQSQHVDKISNQGKEVHNGDTSENLFSPNFMTSHNIRRAPEKNTYLKTYHPKAINHIEEEKPTLPPLTVFSYEHKENTIPLQKLDIINDGITSGRIKSDNFLTTQPINEDNFVTGMNLNNELKELESAPTTLQPSTTTETITTSKYVRKTTTIYDVNAFYKIPRIPRKKEKYLTFCTKEEAIRDENNLVIACGGDYDVWVPHRCPQGSSCFMTNESTYRICCPVSLG